VDFSLAELAADVRASTPSNAAELLVPDRATMLHVVRQQAMLLNNLVHEIVRESHIDLTENQVELRSIIERMFVTYHDKQANRIALLQALNPTKILNRGYAIVRSGGILLKTTTSVAKAERLSIELASGTVEIIIKNQEQ
jgi:exodeoxyribonuclease VII large subunit